MQSPHEMIAEVIALEETLQYVEFGEGMHLSQMIDGLIEEIVELFDAEPVRSLDHRLWWRGRNRSRG